MKILRILIALAALCALPGIVFCEIALRRRRRKKRRRPGSGGGPASFRMERDWLKAQAQEDVWIVSRDGLHLHARLIPRGDCRRFAVVCHGYRAHSASVAPFARGLWERGYALLLPDARAHGESGGRWIGMGWPDRLDLLDWTSELNRRYGAPEIVLMGVSMGGATMLNAAGEALPANVRCIISDCGFCSLRDEFIWQLRRYHHLPALPFLLSADPLCRLLARYSPLWDGDGCAQLAKCRLPVLLIHGAADRFVPPEMMERACAAAAGPVEAHLIPGAAHAESVSTAPERYWAHIDAFLAKYAHS